MARAHLVLSMTLSLRSPWLSIWWGPLSTKQIGAKHCSLADLVNCALTMFLCMWFWLLHIWWMQRFPFCCWPKAALQRISGLQRLWMMRTLCLPRYGLSFFEYNFSTACFGCGWRICYMVSGSNRLPWPPAWSLFPSSGAPRQATNCASNGHMQLQRSCRTTQALSRASCSAVLAQMFGYDVKG